MTDGPTSAETGQKGVEPTSASTAPTKPGRTGFLSGLGLTEEDINNEASQTPIAPPQSPAIELSRTPEEQAQYLKDLADEAAEAHPIGGIDTTIALGRTAATLPENKPIQPGIRERLGKIVSRLTSRRTLAKSPEPITTPETPDNPVGPNGVANAAVAKMQKGVKAGTIKT